MRIAGMLRVKNEARWIERVIRAIEPVCGRVYVLDDHSTDDTAEICRSLSKVNVIDNPLRGIDETRDKNFLLNSFIMPEYDPDWVLHIDGDEELESIAAIEDAIRKHEADSYLFRVLYLWDSETRYRVDGVYANYYRPSLFYTRRSKLDFYTTAHGRNTEANLHCTNVPYDLVDGAVRSEARLLHYGYIDRDLRMRKFDFYNTVDPDNALEDCYRHVIQGDVPECPADAVMKWGGPMQFEEIEVKKKEREEVTA